MLSRRSFKWHLFKQLKLSTCNQNCWKPIPKVYTATSAARAPKVTQGALMALPTTPTTVFGRPIRERVPWCSQQAESWKTPQVRLSPKKKKVTLTKEKVAAEVRLLLQAHLLFHRRSSWTPEGGTSCRITRVIGPRISMMQRIGWHWLKAPIIIQNLQGESPIARYRAMWRCTATLRASTREPEANHKGKFLQ